MATAGGGRKARKPPPAGGGEGFFKNDYRHGRRGSPGGRGGVFSPPGRGPGGRQPPRGPPPRPGHPPPPPGPPRPADPPPNPRTPPPRAGPPPAPGPDSVRAAAVGEQGQPTPFPLSHLAVQWKGDLDAVVQVRWETADGWQPWQQVEASHDMS